MSTESHWTRAARLAPWLAVASTVLLVLVVSRRPQGIHFYDQAMQALALQQWREGISPSPNIVMRADPTDLTRSVGEWLSWWPPSLQLLALPLIKAGVSLGGALRTVFAIATLAGAIGWVRWAQRFQLPAPWLVALAICLPWLRHASENAFRYSAEILSFGLAPWLLLLAARTPAWVRANDTASAGRLFIAGLVLGCGYAMKYSLFVFVACMLAYVAWETRDVWRHGACKLAGISRLALLGFGAAVVPFALRALNTARGSADPMSFGEARHFNPMDLVFAIANPALALADAQGPLFHAFVFPGVLLPARFSGLFAGLNLLAWIALPAGLLLGYLLFRAWRTAAPGETPTRLAIATLSLNALALFILWQVAEVDHTARHLAPCALATLPVALSAGIAWWRHTNLVPRALLAVASSVFVAGPLAYGFIYVAAKYRSLPSGYVTGKSGLALTNFAKADVPTAAAAVRGRVSADVVWMVEDPEMALELPGRFMLAYGDRTVGREMRRLERGPWRTSGDIATSRPQPIALLLNRQGTAADDERHARAVVDAMPKARDWTRHEIPSASFVLWTATVEP